VNPIERSTGKEGLSIGTALGVETLFGLLPDEVIEDRKLKGVRYRELEARYREFKALYVNVHTLIRNYIGSCENTTLFDLSPDQIAIDIEQEIQILTTLCGRYMKCVPYTVNYKRIKNHFPDAKLKVPTTEKQLQEQKLIEQTLAYLPPKLLQRSSTLQIGERVKAVIITHCPIDLLNRTQFQSLTLLESHTGRYKEWADWYTKLHSANQTFNPPFNHLMLQVYGDGVHFSPFPRAMKETIAKAANLGSWTPVTTLEKIRNDLKRLKTLPTTRTPEIEQNVNILLGLRNV